ncbi:hypothetical protein AMD27_12910 [Acinetobacter sp. TGL-Y2]|uniref:hypothetical protein n=1 Tax=Acinetobacter sp. TGL-Y2 TaxID=1407071 RepID=UPI0007A65A06|nr:hypothetical protein [Acinetobacter sp. TGL-Y2]AMW79702.1 hypothetical protein AMD27_12910 [Acinetobacter sp. TGL-Y2]
MNAMTKIAMLTTGLISMGALTACQTTTAPQEQNSGHVKAHHKQDRMTPEQRELYKQKRADRQQMFEQVKKACDGKAVGTAVQIKAGEKVINGSCEIHFKADRKDMKHMRGEHRSMKGEHHGVMKGEVRSFKQNRGEALTDAKRAELTKAYDQRLAQRQAQQQALAKACVGQSHGKAVQIKVGEKTVNGQCLVRFHPEKMHNQASTKAA